MTKRICIFLIALLLSIACLLTACKASGSEADVQKTKDAANTLQYNQPTPTDLDYSLERYNLIRRAYWVN